MPPPLPVPLDNGPSGTRDIGSPRFGILLAILISGGTTTVGSTGNLGLSLRITTEGGASCCIESLGSLPLVASSLSRSPPPPPPPEDGPFLLVIGKSIATSESASAITFCGWLFSLTARLVRMETPIKPAIITTCTTRETPTPSCL